MQLIIAYTQKNENEIIHASRMPHAARFECNGFQKSYQNQFFHLEFDVRVVTNKTRQRHA